jgi:hypothetical protein
MLEFLGYLLFGIVILFLIMLIVFLINFGIFLLIRRHCGDKAAKDYVKSIREAGL